MNKMQEIRKEVKDAALRKVNFFRAEAGLEKLSELPKGQIENSKCCVIANALPVKVNQDTLEPTDESMRSILKRYCAEWGDNQFFMPDEIGDFVTFFDEGAFPELIEYL